LQFYSGQEHVAVLCTQYHKKVYSYNVCSLILSFCFYTLYFNYVERFKYHNVEGPHGRPKLPYLLGYSFCYVDCTMLLVYGEQTVSEGRDILPCHTG
jgi:hypothetical protein